MKSRQLVIVPVIAGAICALCSGAPVDNNPAVKIAHPTADVFNNRVPLVFFAQGLVVNDKNYIVKHVKAYVKNQTRPSANPGPLGYVFPPVGRPAAPVQLAHNWVIRCEIPYDSNNPQFLPTDKWTLTVFEFDGPAGTTKTERVGPFLIEPDFLAGRFARGFGPPTIVYPVSGTHVYPSFTAYGTSSSTGSSCTGYMNSRASNGSVTGGNWSAGFSNLPLGYNYTFTINVDGSTASSSPVSVDPYQE
jgi:hypothetical protein